MRYEEWIMSIDNINRYTWDDFKSDCYYELLITFFKNLLKLHNEDEKKVFVFISRRAFCVFLLLQQKGCLHGWEKVSVFSDRYIMKKLEFDFWTEQEIVLVDDSVITGHHLKETYAMIKRKVEKVKIIPYVFALEAKWEDECLRKSDEIFKNLQYEKIYTHNEILKLSSIESLLFYECGIPYMVELPIITEEGNSALGVKFSRQDFKSLQRGFVGVWTYRECKQATYLQNEMVSGCLILEKNILKRRFSEFIQNLTVRLHIICEPDGVRIIFMPFAVLKSADFSSLESMAMELYDGTTYEKSIKRFKRECNERGKNYKKEIYIALYRAVVYSLSYYIGEEARKFIERVYDKKTVFFEGYNNYSFDKDFLDSIKTVFHNDSEMRYIQRTFFAQPFKEIMCREKVKDLYANIPIREYSYNHVYNAMLDIKNQHHLLHSGQDLFLSIEEMEEFFRSRCLVNDYEQIDNCVSNCISGMLCQGLLVNALRYDSNQDIVYRGFSFGENSDVFYSVSAKVFYAAVSAYYSIIGENYNKKYRFFIFNLYHFFKERLLFGTFISIDEFDFYTRYFERPGDDARQIKNKEFLLDRRDTPYYIRLVEDYIYNLDFS